MGWFAGRFAHFHMRKCPISHAKGGRLVLRCTGIASPFPTRGQRADFAMRMPIFPIRLSRSAKTVPVCLTIVPIRSNVPLIPPSTLTPILTMKTEKRTRLFTASTVVAMACLCFSSTVSALVWNGGGADGDFGNDDNWVGGIAPGIGSEIIFNGTSLNPTVTFSENTPQLGRFYIGSGTSPGSVTFDLEGQSFNSSVSQTSFVGSGAAATWNVNNGSVNMVGGLQIGVSAPGSAVNFSSAALTLSTGEVYVGTVQSGNSLSMQNSSLSAYRLYVGFSNSSAIVQGNSATITGGSLTLANNLVIGQDTSGTGNSLRLEGGAVSNVSVILTGVNSSGNKLVVSGAGTIANASSQVLIGRAASAESTGNSVQVLDGAKLNAASNTIFYVGLSSGSIRVGNNEMLIDGEESTATVGSGSGSINIGDGSNANSVVVRNGGTLTVNGDLLVGNNSGTGNSLVLGDPDDTSGAGNLLVSRELIVRDGNRMKMGAGSIATIERFIVQQGGGFADGTSNAGFTSGELSVGFGFYNGSNIFQVGDNTGSEKAVYRMLGNSSHSFANGLKIEEADGRLVGAGTINKVGGGPVLVINNGEIAPGIGIGEIKITGSIESGENALYDMEIAGIDSFDQVDATGHFAFDGILRVTLLDDFTPEFGHEFQLFDFETASGMFSTLELPELTGELTWDVSRLYITGHLVAVPEPSVWALLILAAGVAGGCRVRRQRSTEGRIARS